MNTFNSHMINNPAESTRLQREMTPLLMHYFQDVWKKLHHKHTYHISDTTGL